MNADFIKYMNAWTLAAGARSIPPETVQDDVFLQGWKDGKSASRSAQYRAAEQFKAQVRFVQALNAVPATGAAEEGRQ